MEKRVPAHLLVFSKDTEDYNQRWAPGEGSGLGSGLWAPVREAVALG